MAHPQGSKYWTDADWDRHWLQNRAYYEQLEDRYVNFAEKSAKVGVIALAGLVAAAILGSRD
jgi:hypothetical protein